MDVSGAEPVFAVASLIASIASLILAVVAIWIALYGKREAEQTNRDTRELLVEVRTDAKAIAQYAIPELKAYGDSVRSYVFNRDDGETAGESFMSKFRSILEEDRILIRKDIESIRDAKDIGAVRQKLPTLEERINYSQERVRESVESLPGLVRVYLRGQPKWSVTQSDWEWFLGYLDKYEGFKFADYGTRWVLVEPVSGGPAPERAVKNPWRTWGIRLGEVRRLSLEAICPQGSTQTDSSGAEGESATQAGG